MKRQVVYTGLLLMMTSVLLASRCSGGDKSDVSSENEAGEPTTDAMNLDEPGMGEPDHSGLLGPDDVPNSGMDVGDDGMDGTMSDDLFDREPSEGGAVGGDADDL